jgi:type I restriction enzyme, S subunit
MIFPRYSEYKDTGLEWLARLPSHWEVRRLASLSTKITNGYVGPTRDILIDEGVRYLQSLHVKGNRIKFDVPYFVSHDWSAAHKKSILQAGDVLIVQTGDIGQVAVVTKEFAGCNCHALIIVSPFHASVDGIWLASVLNSHYGLHSLLSIQTGALHPHLNCGDVKDVRIPVPPKFEQSQIAAFLERETAKIDALVAEQQRLIAILKEKRQTTISHAVTKGLNPNATMKPSGVEYLGDVPTDWNVVALKRLIANVESGTSVNAIDEPAGAGQPGVLSTSCVYSGEFNPNENKTVIEDELSRVSCPLKRGSLIVSRMNTPELIGSAGFVNDAPANLFLPDRLWQISFLQTNTRFIHYWTLSAVYRAQIKVACSGASSSMKSLGQDQFGNFAIATPALDEQEMIVRFLDLQTLQLDTLDAEAKRAVNLLKERRSALITAAVTGQIDVRGLVQQEAA